MQAKINLTYLFSVIYVLSFFASSLYLNVGFALKVSMLFSFALFFLYLLNGSLKVYLNSYDYIFILLILYGGGTVLFSQDVVSGSRMFFGSMIIFFSYLVIKKYFYQQHFSFEQIVKLLTLVGYLFIVVSLFYYLVGMLIVAVDFLAFEQQRVYGVMVERGMPRLIGILKDPNIFVFYSSFFFFLVFFKRNKSFFDKLFLLLCFLSILLTISRGGLIAILVPLLLYYFYKFVSFFKNLKLNLKSLLISFLVATSVFIFIFWLATYPIVLDIIMKRIDTAGTGSGRFEIWVNAFSLFKENYIFGVGWYNFLSFNIEYFGRANYAHNTFIEVLVELGLIGAILYLIFWTSILFSILKLISNNINYRFLLFTFLSFFISFNSLSLVINEVFFLFLALISVFLLNEKKSKNHGCNISC